MLNEIIIALIASFMTMDAVIFGQFGFSRPIVCGPIIGFVVGNPVAGLHIGAILELIWINTIPIGTTLVPDVTVATVIAVRWASYILAPSVSSTATEGAAAAISMMIALPISLIFRKMDLTQRIRASRYNLYLEEAVKNGRYAAVGRVIFLSSAEHYFRNFLLFLLAFYLARFLPSFVTGVVPPDSIAGLNLGYHLLPAVGIGVFFYNFYDSVVKILKR